MVKRTKPVSGPSSDDGPADAAVSTGLTAGLTERGLPRRDFLRLSGTAIGGAFLAQALPLNLLKPLSVVDNALAVYPEGGWERVYWDQYRYDSSFTFVCSPNDTHHCGLRAFDRNGQKNVTLSWWPLRFGPMR